MALQVMGGVLLAGALLMWTFDEEAAVALSQRGAGARPAAPGADATPLLLREVAAAPPAARPRGTRPGAAAAAGGPAVPAGTDATDAPLGRGGVAADGAVPPQEPLDVS